MSGSGSPGQRLKVRLVIAAATALAVGGAASAATVVGGITPSVRPAGAPVVTTYPKGDAWFAWARRGVSQPYPASLGFLADEGGWYTPFTRRGMPGRYDIRGLHALPDTPPATAR